MVPASSINCCIESASNKRMAHQRDLHPFIRCSSVAFPHRRRFRQLAQRVLVLALDTLGGVFTLDRQQAAAIGAGLRQWPVPHREVARRPVGAAVEGAAALGALFDQIAAVARTLHADLDEEGSRVTAGGEITAPDELAEAPPANHQRLATRGAGFTDL